MKKYIFNIKKEVKNLIIRRLSVSDFYNYLNSKWTKNNIHIYIACLPKSGSTFIANALVNITNFDFVQFQPLRGTNDHNINLDLFLTNLNRNTITQLHTKPNEHNALIFKKYELKVIFLNRGILDSITSFHSHVLNESDQWFMFTNTEKYREWEIEKQFDFLIDLVIPWYINFLVSWKKVIKEGGIKVLEVDFDDFKQNNTKVINDILNFYGLHGFCNVIDKGLKNSYSNKEKLRYNSSNSKISYSFSVLQIERIKIFLSYYPEFDIKL
jgi:hypothetical protein